MKHKDDPSDVRAIVMLKFRRAHANPQEDQMDEDEVVLAMIKHEISKLDAAAQTAINERAATFRALVDEPDGFNAMAFALVGAELAARK